MGCPTQALPFCGARFCPSFFSMASTTKCMSGMSWVTQYSLRRWCSSFGMRVANCVQTSPSMPPSSSTRWTTRPTPTPATAANDLRLRTRGRSRYLLTRYPLGNSPRRTTGTTWAPCSTSPATTTVRRLRRAGGDASEERLDRGAHLLLYEVVDHGYQAALSWHLVPPSAMPSYTRGRPIAKMIREVTVAPVISAQHPSGYVRNTLPSQ